MLKLYLIFIFSIILSLLTSLYIYAKDDLAQKLSGKILLQVQSHGEAWYINPLNNERYYLGRPKEAIELIRKSGIGITNNDLSKIRMGLIQPMIGRDSDEDGLSDAFEKSIGTNRNKKDTDDDGYNDLIEIINGYNHNGSGILKIDQIFSLKNSGKIFIQTESKGEAWYINPSDLKRYYLGRPEDMLIIMKRLSIGITDLDLQKIPIFKENISNTSNNNTQIDYTGDKVIGWAANAIRARNKTLAESYFIPTMKFAIYYNLDNMLDESILALGNLLSGSKLTYSSDTEKIYSNEAYFPLGDQNIPLEFHVEKQPDGSWKMTNL